MSLENQRPDFVLVWSLAPVTTVDHRQIAENERPLYQDGAGWPTWAVLQFIKKRLKGKSVLDVSVHKLTPF